MPFLHGVEVIEVDAGARPIEAVSASVIGLLGSAFQGPVNIPTLITSRGKAEETFGVEGTIKAAIDAIFDQISGRVVVVNALDPAIHKTNVAAGAFRFSAQGLGGTLDVGKTRLIASTVEVTDNAGNTTYDVDDDYTFDAATGIFTRVPTGAIAAGGNVKITFDYVDESKITDANITASALKLVEAESVTGAKPRIIIAPEFTSRVTRATPVAPITAVPVTSGLIAVADRLRAVIVADGPGTTDADAIAYRGLLSSRRVYLVDPEVRLSDGAGGTDDAPASARVAGVIVKNDRERGYWSSPSNREILGVLGTSRAVTFTLGDENSSANLLNADQVATIIRLNGYRLWGNRTTSDDAKWAFLGVVRTADIINESLLAAHLWAIDRNLTKTYIEDVVESVNDFLRRLIAQGAILSGRCWADPDLNDAAARDAGRVYFDFEFDPPSPAERITFRSRISAGDVE